MADKQWNIAIPPGLLFVGGYKIQVQALNPTTGAFVSGVQVQNVAFQVDMLSGGGSDRIDPVLLLLKGSD